MRESRSRDSIASRASLPGRGLDAYQPGHRRLTRSPSTLFQSVLYFNILYSMVFVVFAFVAMVHRLNTYRTSLAFEIATPVVFTLWAAIEGARLYFGYFGNLQERVPELSAFVFVTIFPQFPATLFLGVAQQRWYPVDTAISGIMVAFLVIELLMGVRIVRRVIEKRMAQFYDLCTRGSDAGSATGDVAGGGGARPDRVASASNASETAPLLARALEMESMGWADVDADQGLALLPRHRTAVDHRRQVLRTVPRPGVADERDDADSEDGGAEAGAGAGLRRDGRRRGGPLARRRQRGGRSEDERREGAVGGAALEGRAGTAGTRRREPGGEEGKGSEPDGSDEDDAPRRTTRGRGGRASLQARLAARARDRRAAAAAASASDDVEATAAEAGGDVGVGGATSDASDDAAVTAMGGDGGDHAMPPPRRALDEGGEYGGTGRRQRRWGRGRRGLEDEDLVRGAGEGDQEVREEEEEEEEEGGYDRSGRVRSRRGGRRPRGDPDSGEEYGRQRRSRGGPHSEDAEEEERAPLRGGRRLRALHSRR